MKRLIWNTSFLSAVSVAVAAAGTEGDRAPSDIAPPFEQRSADLLPDPLGYLGGLSSRLVGQVRYVAGEPGVDISWNYDRGDECGAPSDWVGRFHSFDTDYDVTLVAPWDMSLLLVAGRRDGGAVLEGWTFHNPGRDPERLELPLAIPDPVRRSLNVDVVGEIGDLVAAVRLWKRNTPTGLGDEDYLGRPELLVYGRAGRLARVCPLSGAVYGEVPEDTKRFLDLADLGGPFERLRSWKSEEHGVFYVLLDDDPEGGHLVLHDANWDGFADGVSRRPVPGQELRGLQMLPSLVARLEKP